MNIYYSCWLVKNWLDDSKAGSIGEIAKLRILGERRVESVGSKTCWRTGIVMSRVVKHLYGFN